MILIRIRIGMGPREMLRQALMFLGIIGSGAASVGYVIRGGDLSSAAIVWGLGGFVIATEIFSRRRQLYNPNIWKIERKGPYMTFYILSPQKDYWGVGPPVYPITICLN